MVPNRKHGKINIASLVDAKHKEYAFKAKMFSYLYYATRLVGGLSAGIIPFTITNNIFLSKVLSIIVVLVTVIDLVFNPKDKWVLFSKATDLLTIAQIKKEGNYEAYKGILDTVLKTETANLERLVDLNTLMQTVENAKSKTVE